MKKLSNKKLKKIVKTMKKWRKMSSHQVPKRKAIRPISQ